MPTAYVLFHDSPRPTQAPTLRRCPVCHCLTLECTLLKELDDGMVEKEWFCQTCEALLLAIFPAAAEQPLR